ncbi:MAG TPA: hypothetical protein PKX12_14160 [Spirochaetota bacterium]|nr:hypothetical protein [Spirochaetota bacterium]
MKKLTALTLLLLLLCTVFSFGKSRERTTVLTEQFFTNLSAVSVLRRDEYIRRRLKGTISGTCIVKKTDALPRYDQKYRIIGTHTASGFTFHYYLFTGNKSLSRSVQAGKKFLFTGTFMSHTPLNMMKDAYIIDVKLSPPENDD